MKTIKRFFLRPAYWFALLFSKHKYVTFNHWLSKNGYWRLTNWLDNLKLIVPKNYHEFIKNNPDIPYITPLEAKKESNTTTTKFYYYSKDNNK